MDYAKNLLKKYGWKEGDGLGKNSDGISEPLKANLKFDTAGLGVDKASEFNNHWWERVFNEAANNLDVNKSKEEDVIIATKSDSVEITTKEYSGKNLKKGHASYEHFVKKSVLNGLREDPNGSKPNELDPDISQLPKYTLLTDNELFAACGGRTAHKGARHGLKLSGKLLRIEEQERDLLQKMQEKVKCVEKEQDDWKLVTTKRKKQHPVEPEDRSELDGILYTNEYFIKSKKKRKKQKQLDDELSSTINSVSIGVVSAKVNNDKTTDIIDNRKKKCNKVAQIYEHGDENDVEMASVRKEMEFVVKKKRKIVHAIENGTLNTSNFLKSNDLNFAVGQVSKKKKKKQKRCDKIERELESSLTLSTA